MFLKITCPSLLNWPIPNFKWQLQVERKKQIFCLVLHLVIHFMKTKDLKLWVCWLENEHVPRLEFEIYENKHLHLLILQPTQRDVIKSKSPNIKYFCTTQYLCSLFELKTYIWKFVCCNLNWNCFWIVTNELWNFISYQSSHYTNTVPCAIMAHLPTCLGTGSLFPATLLTQNGWWFNFKCNGNPHFEVFDLFLFSNRV